MKLSEHHPVPIRLLAVVAGAAAAIAPIASADTSRPWRYVLLSGSSLVDDCPICARPTIEEPMRGSFNLRLVEATPLFSRYAVEDIDFKAGTTRTYTVRGSGTFRIGGEIALTQQMSLDVEIDDGAAKKQATFTNSSAMLSRIWPMMDITVEQTNGTFTQTYSLRLAAAPVREMWFSTRDFFTAGSGPDATHFVMGGDLISSTGRIVARNHEFYGAVGATPPGPDLGLDAVDVLPGGEMAFSLDSGFPQTNIGPVYGGDLLSTRGRRIFSNQELMAAFVIQPPAPDAGLDAVHISDDEEVRFSIESDIFSEKLGKLLHRGDLLSSAGTIVRTNQQLLSKFHPANPAADSGLDALYIWPHGEIWFSTESDFTDNEFGPVSAGDLLSDQGYMVFRNADLLSGFAPVQDQPSFGLDCLYVITDALPQVAAANVEVTTVPATQSLRLKWQSEARVFQVERASSPGGPFEAISPIIPAVQFDDTGALTAHSRGFYRIVQW